MAERASERSRFKATAVGWQTRIDEEQKDWFRTHSPA